MTLIQPNKHKNLLNAIIILLIVAVTGAVIGLVFEYNKTVDLTQGAVALENQTSQLQAQNSELKSATFALLDPDHLSSLAAADGMAPGVSPHYISVPTWVADSHF